MNRKERVERMLNSVNDWDLDTLIESVQDTMRDRFDGMSDTDLDFEYDACFEDDDEEVEREVEATPQRCRGGRAIMRQ